MFALAYQIIYYIILIFLVPDVYRSIEGDSMSCTLSFVYVCAPPLGPSRMPGHFSARTFPHASHPAHHKCRDSFDPL